VRPESVQLAMVLGIRGGSYLILNDKSPGNFFLESVLHFEGVKIGLFGELDGAL
jgi:hypothetical protein